MELKEVALERANTGADYSFAAPSITPSHKPQRTSQMICRKKRARICLAFYLGRQPLAVVTSHSICELARRTAYAPYTVRVYLFRHRFIRQTTTKNILTRHYTS